MKTCFFTAGNGTYGVVGEHCPHRGTSLYYGLVEDDGIRCPYHGWKYDACGNCVEQPFENTERVQGDNSASRISGGEAQRHPVRVFRPAERKPLLPKWDLLLRQDGVKKIESLRGAALQLASGDGKLGRSDAIHTIFIRTR